MFNVSLIYIMNYNYRYFFSIFFNKKYDFKIVVSILLQTLSDNFVDNCGWDSIKVNPKLGNLVINEIDFKMLQISKKISYIFFLYVYIYIYIY